MKVTSLRYLDAKFHHPSPGASPPVACLQNCYNSRISCSRSAIWFTLRYDSININLMNYSWTNGRLAIPALAGLLVSTTADRRTVTQSNHNICRTRGTQLIRSRPTSTMAHYKSTHLLLLTYFVTQDASCRSARIDPRDAVLMTWCDPVM